MFDRSPRADPKLMSAFCAISDIVKSIESGSITDCNCSGDTDAMEIVG